MTAPGPLEAATAWLVAWLADVTDGSVQTAPPADEPGAGAALAVWPLSVLPEPELRTARRREPFRCRVRHLVVAAGEAAASTRLLDRALVAAIERGEPTVEFGPMTDHAWLALGCRPRVALLVDVPALIERPMPEVPLVREPLRTHLTPGVPGSPAHSKEAR